MDLVKMAALTPSSPDGHWGVESRLVEEAEGRLRVQACEMVAGGGAESHVHEDHDQMFVVLDGALVVRGADGHELVARGGEAVRIPAGSPHATVNDSDRTARYLVLTYPAGREA
jgi:quercetin dioxygenase-like cupin family protein